MSKGAKRTIEQQIPGMSTAKLRRLTGASTNKRVRMAAYAERMRRRLGCFPLLRTT